MEAIAKYQKASSDLAAAIRWFSLIGKEYRGGGGGFGEVVRLSVTAEIYSQAYDGATNYHAMPKRLGEFVASAVRLSFDELAKGSIAAMELEIKELAKKAAEEHAALMQVAGIK